MELISVISYYFYTAKCQLFYVSDGYRLFFYSSDRPEPVHIHVEQAGRTAKIWLRPIRIDSSHGFSRSELNEVVKIVTANLTQLLERWNEFFSDEE